MRKDINNIFANIDWLIILLYTILVIFGWVNIYAATSDGTSKEIFDFSTMYGKHLVRIFMSVVLIILILFLNSRFYERFSSLMYLLSIILLAGVLVFGKKINNATSWYSLGGISLQPSEFAKVFTALGVAKIMSSRQYNLKAFKNQLKVFFIILLPAFFIALQPDMGSVLIYLSFLFVLNREGLPLIYIGSGVLAIFLFLSTVYLGMNTILIFSIVSITIINGFLYYKNKYFIRDNWLQILLSYIIIICYTITVPTIFNQVFQKHQRDRIEVFLGMKSDNAGISYNSNQAQLTVSSGELFGKGFLQGDRTKGHFVPEQETDYIFSVVAEEWGFVGSSLVVIVFIVLIYRVIYLSEKTPHKFGRIFGYGVASIFFFHVMINVGMVIGLFPTVGIPLPFFSYGGSGLWGFTMLIFIFIRLDAHRDNEY